MMQPGSHQPAPGAATTAGARAVDGRRQGLSFGGVTFDLRWAPGWDFEMYEAERDACLGPGTTPVAAHVACDIEWRPADVMAPLVVAAEQGQAGVRRFVGLGTDGTLRRLAPGRYAASLNVNPSTRGCGAALRTLAGLVLEAEGGLCLHAAALEIDGGAVLFLGPSGAGKSTACNLAGGRALAYDHVAVTGDGAGGYRAWRVPFGEPSELPLTASPVLPLRAVLRVVHGVDSPRIESGDPVQGLFDVRAAIDVADPGASSEAIRLAAAERLCAAIPVGRVATVLEQPLGTVVLQWLRASGGARG